MNIQEARMKNDIKRKDYQQYYHELYFPNMRSTLFSIFTGKDEAYKALDKSNESDVSRLSTEYEAAILKLEVKKALPVHVSFTNDGLMFSIVKKTDEDENKPMEIEFSDYLQLFWTQDKELLLSIANIMNRLVLSLARIIPTLNNDRLSFKNVSIIETNPIYDQMAFTYAMFKELDQITALPKCYIQALMARKRVTYNMLCHTLKLDTPLPTPISNYLAGNIVKRHTYTIKTINDQVITNEYMALFLVDYNGQIFNVKLQLQASERMIYENTRSIEVEANPSVLN